MITCPPIIECVPNVSEGRDLKVIRQLENSIQSAPGVRLLHVDIGRSANRTVFTFAGHPDQVVEAAFRLVSKTSELIDMRKHKGEHPRLGATDVLPLVPVSGVSMLETVEHSHKLGQRIGEELNIPVYCYEEAAFHSERKKLEYCRSGEYEGLRERMKLPEWKPDFGPDHFNEKAGAVIVGARNYLVAYNVNLETSSVEIAKDIAAIVRESGTKNQSGTLKTVKAIGWYIEEYGKTQVSMNLTNLSITALHIAFEEVKKIAGSRGIKVSGSELIGLIPLNALLGAGKFYMAQHKIHAVTEPDIIQIAVKYLGLDELRPFIPSERIIEYLVNTMVR